MAVLDTDRYVDRKRRTMKAEALARALWPKGDADRPPIDVVRSYARDMQRRWEKVAWVEGDDAPGLTTTHPQELWDEVIDLLVRMEQWEQRNQVIPMDRLIEILSAPVKAKVKAPAVYPPGAPVPVCILRCLCGGHVPGGRSCPEHGRWVNPTPDPTRTLDALKARGPVAPPTSDRYGPVGQIEEPKPEKRPRRRR